MERIVTGRKFTSRLKRWFAASLSITLGANIVTTPLVAYYFGAVSIVSVLTNLATLWAVSLIFYGVLFACVLSLIAIPAGSAIAWVIGFLIRYVTTTAKLLASIPLAAVYTESIYIIIWLVACYLLLAVFLLLRKRSIPALVTCLVGMLALSLTLSWVEPRLDDCRVTALDVGQGQAVILQSEGKTYLVDCGSNKPEDAADKTADYLLSIGVFRLDGIIVTHYDTDHVGGIPYLLNRISADTVYLPKAGADDVAATDVIAAAESIFWVEEDVNWIFGDAAIQLFAPETLEMGNESSICILFQTENCDILVTGDRSREGELRLLQRTQLPELELLIAGHHGSKNATSESLLSLTSPEYVFISAGENNRYGHPSKEVLERLERHGCTVYRTGRQGDLIFRR
jgi:competence protein ComEC